MTPKQALNRLEKFQQACSLLVIHGFIPDGERDKIRARLHKWALRHGLRRAS